MAIQDRIRLFAVLTTSGLLVACPPPADDEAGQGEGIGQVSVVLQTHVETVTLEVTDFREDMEMVGETEAVLSAGVSTQIPGRITHFDLEVGDEVTEGDTVLRVDTQSQRAQIPALEVQIRQLEVEIGRTGRLIDQGLASDSMLEQLTAQRDATEEGIDAIRTVAGMGRNRAPISGTVIEARFEEGEYAMPGMEVARIADLSTIVVRVGLPERDLRYVHEGMAVSVFIEALDLEREGRLDQIAYQADGRNRTFPLEIHVDNSDNAIRIGMRAHVQLTRQALDDVVVIPRDSLLMTFEGQEVFVIEGDVAYSRTVELGPAQGRFVVVTSGLSAGEQLVTRGQRSLLDGRPVSVVTNVNCCLEQLAQAQERR